MLIASAIIVLSLPAFPALAEQKPDDSPSFMLKYFDAADKKKPSRVQLEQSIGAVKVGASASFQKPNSRNVAAGEEAETLGVGVRLGFGGFTVEGAYEGAEGDNAGLKKSYGASLGYTGGPFSATVGYVYDQDIAAGQEKDALKLGATYRLSPGIAAHGNLQYREEGSATEKKWCGYNRRHRTVILALRAGRIVKATLCVSSCICQKMISSDATTAIAAENAGSGSVVTLENTRGPFPPHIFATIATKRVKIGTAIAIASPRNPTIMAHATWRSHKASNGWLHLGIGSQIKGDIE